MDKDAVSRYCDHDVGLEEVRNQLACVRFGEVVHVNPASIVVAGELVSFEALSVVACVVVSIRWSHRGVFATRGVRAAALPGAEKLPRHEHDRSST